VRRELAHAVGNGRMPVSLVECPDSFLGGPRVNSETVRISASQSCEHPREAKTVSEFPSRGRVSRGNVCARECAAPRDRVPSQENARAGTPARGELFWFAYARTRVEEALQRTCVCDGLPMCCTRVPSESLCARAHFESEHPDSAFPGRWSSRKVAPHVRTRERVSESS